MWILPHLPLCGITNNPPFSSPSCQFPVEFSRISIKSVFPCVNIPSKSAAFHKTAPVLLAPDFKKISLLSFQSPFPPPRFANISLSRPQQTASHRAQPKPPCGRFSAACGRCGGAAAPPGLRPKVSIAPCVQPKPPSLPKPPSTRHGQATAGHPHRFPIPAAASRSRRAQPKPPCGRFSAARGRCGGAAAPPGLRSKAPSPPAPNQSPPRSQSPPKSRPSAPPKPQKNTGPAPYGRPAGILGSVGLVAAIFSLRLFAAVLALLLLAVPTLVPIVVFGIVLGIFTHGFHLLFRE